MGKALKKQKKALQKKILSVNNKGDKPNFIDTLNGYVSDEINGLKKNMLNILV